MKKSGGCIMPSEIQGALFGLLIGVVGLLAVLQHDHKVRLVHLESLHSEVTLPMPDLSYLYCKADPKYMPEYMKEECDVQVSTD